MEFLRFLYTTLSGRMLLRPLTAPALSLAAGAFLDTPLSSCLIVPFAKHNQIDLSEYEMDGVRSFNAFFSRKIKDGLRPVDQDPGHLIAPCDGLLSVWPIREDTVLPVKQSCFTIPQLLRDEMLARRFRGGLCFVFRLCVNHYHRYVYVDSGRKSSNRFLPGCLHTVRPIALREVPVFTENSREYTLIASSAFGPLIQMEVGAMLVGRIRNHQGRGMAVRGAEKGMFQYGGSTVIVLAGPNRVRVSEEILAASARGTEYPVMLGQKIGEAIRIP